MKGILGVSTIAHISPLKGSVFSKSVLAKGGHGGFTACAGENWMDVSWVSLGFRVHGYYDMTF